jgi:hypothetical protein
VKHNTNTTPLVAAVDDTIASVNSAWGPYQRLIVAVRRLTTLQLSEADEAAIIAMLKAFAAQMRNPQPRAISLGLLL